MSSGAHEVRPPGHEQPSVSREASTTESLEHDGINGLQSGSSRVNNGDIATPLQPETPRVQKKTARYCCGIRLDFLTAPWQAAVIPTVPATETHVTPCADCVRLKAEILRLEQPAAPCSRCADMDQPPSCGRCDAMEERLVLWQTACATKETIATNDKDGLAELHVENVTKLAQLAQLVQEAGRS